MKNEIAQINAVHKSVRANKEMIYRVKGNSLKKSIA